MLKRDPNKKKKLLLGLILIIVFCKITIFFYDRVLFPKKSPSMIEKLKRINDSVVDTADKLWFYKKKIPEAIIIGCRKSGNNFNKT